MKVFSKPFLIILVLITISCNSENQKTPPSQKHQIFKKANRFDDIEKFQKGIHLKVSDIPLPEGFKRIEPDKESFAYYLQNFLLDQNDNIVHLYNGKEKRNQNVHYAILDIDVGSKDLQQCADAVMRLKAEYHYKRKEYSKIHFNFTSGHEASFEKYAQGYRPQINGSNVSWIQNGKKGYDYENFRKYMDLVFTYAGSKSLSQELNKVDDFSNIEIGNVLIIGGFPGHAEIVMDMAIDSLGNKIFLLAQSYMPAQEIHILKNFNDKEISPWYRANNDEDFIDTPEYYFEKSNLMKFAD